MPFDLFNGLWGVFFLDDQHGWVWGNVNYRTTDGGTTWEELPFLGSAYFMEFFSLSFGVTTGNFGAYVSRDGGLTWAPSPEGMAAFSFADDLTGLGVAATGLYRTTDGGDTFTLVAGRRGRRRGVPLLDGCGGDRRRNPGPLGRRRRDLDGQHGGRGPQPGPRRLRRCGPGLGTKRYPSRLRRPHLPLAPTAARPGPTSAR